MRATLGLVLGAAILIALTALTGNSDAIDPSAIQDTAALPTPLRDSIGQTFVAHSPRLSAIQVLWNVPANYSFSPGERITLHLRASPSSESDLAIAWLPLDAAAIRNNEFSKFTFAPIPDSDNQSYYFFFDAPADALALWSSGEDAYADGALYVNHVSTPRDLSFRAYYTPDLVMLIRALGDVLARFGFPAIVLWFILLVLFYLPLYHSPRRFRFAALGCASLAFGVALLQIRDLPAPLWVDSLTHAQYVQFILTNARLPLVNFYHLGFHVLAALFAKIANLSISDSLLLTGQFSWVLVGVAVFFQSRKVSNSDLAGLVSAVCVWFLSPTPAYFITWGRYPLVLGSALLAGSLYAFMQLIAQRNARNLCFAAITFGILAFTQIRLVAFYAAFFFIYWLLAFQRARTTHSPNSILQLPTSKQSLILLISFLFIPALWLLYLFSGGVTLQSILVLNQTAPSIDLQTALDVALTHHGLELWLLAAVSIVVGIVLHSRVTPLMLGWLVALVAIALALRAPILGELVPLSLIVLMAFLPAAILIGDMAQFVYERWRMPNRLACRQQGGADQSFQNRKGLPVFPSVLTPPKFYNGALVRAAVWVALTEVTLVIGGVSILGARDMVNIANPATILFTRADEHAVDWIDANVPRDSRFLVNSFNWFGNAFVPSDGGGWISFFTGNAVEYLDASSLQGDSESVLAQWIKSHRINYIYLGTHVGTLSASEFLAHPENFSMVYDREGVKIFQIH